MPPVRRTTIATLAILLVAIVSLQGWQLRSDALQLPAASEEATLYVRSPDVVRRAMLSYQSIAADVYWIRAVQHYGATKLSGDPRKQYAELYPLLDIATTLDPKFTIAYRFGAIFLAEPYPNGPGRTDLAIKLLEKGLKADPKKWEYAEDIGFVHYWWRQDYAQAAEWFRRAAAMPDAPNWLNGVAAVTLAEGGNRESSRRLWQEMLKSDAEWLRRNAEFRLAQLDAMDQIDALQHLEKTYEARTGQSPRSWADLARAGLITAMPLDPQGTPYRLDPDTGVVTLDPASRLNPLPTLHPRPPVR